ncbi:MAG: uroporphyrinogen-III C-methyltransferase [Burkholderiaceae bacterium]
MASETFGTVYLVGAGPGATDLLTLRAARLLEAADIVFHDALVHADTLALAPYAIKVAVGKRCGRLSSAQHFINKRLIDAAHEHRVVVRLKGGDPMLFGRVQEEIDALKGAGVPFEIVPGVTAALAASAELETSLTRRADASFEGSRSVVFVTPRVAADASDSDARDAMRWIAAVNAADTAVLYMASRQADRIAALLIAAGRKGSTPVALVENASLPNVFTCVMTLAELAREGLTALDGPATLVIGEIVRQAVVLDVDRAQEKSRAA